MMGLYNRVHRAGIRIGQEWRTFERCPTYDLLSPEASCHMLAAMTLFASNTIP